MINPLPPLPQALPWRRRLLAFAGLVLLTGCANGDFGEPRTTLVSDDLHDLLGPLASTGSVATRFELTDDERQLRALSQPLIEPPYISQPWYYVVVKQFGIGSDRAALERTTYANCLLASRYHSPSARYSQLMDDIRSDITRMPQFFETAGRVLDMDQKRRKSLAYVSALTQAERSTALKRIRDNEAIVLSALAKLTQRAMSYRFALERLVIMTPSSQAVDVERSITQMLADIARYRHPAPSWKREQSLATAL